MADYTSIAVIGLFLLTMAVTSTIILWIRAKKQGIPLEEYLHNLRAK